MIRLKEIRKSRGYSQKDFAALINVPNNTYNQWENGKRSPDYESVLLIAKKLSVSVDYLLGSEGTPPADTPSAAQKFMEALPLDSLDDEELQKLVEYAEFLVSQKRKKK